MNPILRVEQLSITFGINMAVNDVSFQLETGEIGCLLGPSGCGKTSLLRAIAGFEPLHQGAIYLNDKLIVNKEKYLPPEKRNIGMVFQDFALFPHLDVEDNIAFGLQHLQRSEQQQRIKELLALVSLQGYENRYPHELSGGQQQRIALARALAPKPALLLMDEPFSSMDAELRGTLAAEIRRILKTEKISAILVTHDQNEAFVTADKIGVMKEGELQQWSDSQTLYQQPATPFIADFIGQGAFIASEIIDDNTLKTSFSLMPTPQVLIPQGSETGKSGKLFIRPDAIRFDSSSNIKATVLDKKFQGEKYLYTLQIAKEKPLFAFDFTERSFELGAEIGITLQPKHCLFFANSNAND